MMEFDSHTIGALVSLLTKFGVPFNEKFLKIKWDPNEDVKTELNPTDSDRKAAWDLYVEMETRITTQPLDPVYVDEKTALSSVYSLFQTTRILLKQGPDCVVFAKIAITILNQKVRPFTTKWHIKSMEGAFNDPSVCAEFRQELESLQEVLRVYARTLAVLAGITDVDSLSEEA